MDTHSSNYTSALSHAASFCSKAERCKSDVIAAIAKFELSKDEGSALMYYLEKEGYIDEARFARAYANDKFRFQHWGRVKIRYMLAEKHIESGIIEDALTVIDEDEYMETLRKLVMDKLKSTTAPDDYTLAAKILRFACGKGYEPECVRKCLSLD